MPLNSTTAAPKSSAPADPLKESPMLMRVTDRDLVTILAALRYWQHALGRNDNRPPQADHFDDIVTPLTVDEIDELCEKLNLGSSVDQP
jgi:hypothetical protein